MSWECKYKIIMLNAGIKSQRDSKIRIFYHNYTILKVVTKKIIVCCFGQVSEAIGYKLFFATSFYSKKIIKKSK